MEMIKSKTGKILYVAAVLVGAAAFGKTLPAYSQGSMAPEVRVIIVNPSPTMLKLSARKKRIREARQEKRRQINQQNREIQRVNRELQRAAERRNRELDKRMHRERFAK